MNNLYIVPFHKEDPAQYGRECKIFCNEEDADSFEQSIRPGEWSYIFAIPLSPENIEVMERAILVPGFKPIEEAKFEAKINNAIDETIADMIQIEPLIDSQKILEEVNNES